MAAPPMMSGDLFIVSAGPGSLATVSALIGQAKAAGASFLFLTAQAQSQTAKIVDHTILVTAQTMANDQKKMHQHCLWDRLTKGRCLSCSRL